ncbi:MAG: DUF1289 domain-containing protein [Pseudomonadota bacterium]
MVKSPCTGVCKLDGTTGWCIGCGRSGDEIADWGSRSTTSRDRVWDQIPDRLSELGVTCRRLPWTTEEIRTFVARSLEKRRGTWVMGVVGAVAEFIAAPDAQVEIEVNGCDVTARTRNGALRMHINDDARAVTFDPPGLAAEPRIVIAVKRSLGRLPLSEGIADLGPDNGLLPDPEGRLYDLGLGRKDARFCVRVANGMAKRALEQADGLTLMQSLSQIAPPLIAESPTRVVETALGRIEVQGQIPPPGARSPEGPHTHLLPDHLATGRSLPVGMELPRSYLPGAIFYPRT